ncbi:peptidase caspase catalytic [Fusarium sporotrichioides]|uniref:Peptidase caspase catalytic n=1 Tax=Fusarium sporotrichioides TaxID=5514 RepID=A0A395SHA6_FUSSP|nr:peptidase caspase catalytic [Fusarium sporotrichioides]
MWQRLLQWKRRPARYAEISEGNELSHQLLILKPLEDAAIDDEAWGGEDPSSCWPLQLPEGDFDQARIISFSYSYMNLKTLGDLIDPVKLRDCAEALLRDYPLRVASTPSIADAPGHRSNELPVDISKPVIFVAHGFGGLIYEQALTVSYKSDPTPSSPTPSSATQKRSRKHAVLLLDTPHHGAGMADWAIVCAKRLGIPCASTRQKQKWSALVSQLDDIERMQRDFRQIIRRNDVDIKIHGCFAMDPMPCNYLRIAPEWTVLPDFQVLGLEQSHFGMTKIEKGTSDFERFCTALRQRAKQLIGENASKKASPDPSTAVEMPGDYQATDIQSDILPAEVSESPFGDLRGPLNDVASMEAILKTQGFSISQCSGQVATRANILAAWNSLIGSISSSGDTVMIYYCGHGGIVQDREESRRGEQDEPSRYRYIVPMDLQERPLKGTYDYRTYHYSDGPFLGILDIEIAHLLHKTTQRTPNVTVIFDCSYSGLLTRALTHPETAMSRNLPILYHDKLSSHISRLQYDMEYPEESVSQLKSNENVVCIEAAAIGETAWDEVFDGEPMGAMTKALVSVLQAVGTNSNVATISWQNLMQRVRELVNLDFPRQHPVVAGPARRILFSTEVTEADGSLIEISDINETNTIGHVKAGTASGVRENNVYALMPLGEGSVNESKQIGTATITKVYNTHSKVQLSLTNVSDRIPDEGLRGFLIEEAPIKWPVSVPDDVLGLMGDIAKSRYLRSTDAARKERFLASFHRYEDTITLRTMQGVQIARCEVSDNDSESWTNARRNLVTQAEQLAKAHQLQTLVCDNHDEQLDHKLDITLNFAQDMQGSIFKNTDVSISLVNRGAERLHVSLFFITVTGRIRVLGRANEGYPDTLKGYGSCSLELKVIWTKDIPKTNPIKEHLFFIITDYPVDLHHLETKIETESLVNESDLSDLSPYDLVIEALRKDTHKNPRKVRYDTRHFTFNIEPREFPGRPILVENSITV